MLANFMFFVSKMKKSHFFIRLSFVSKNKTDNKYSLIHSDKKKAVNPRSLEFTAFFSVPCENRTHNWGLGGSCYIHLTKGTYSAFVPLSLAESNELN